MTLHRTEHDDRRDRRRYGPCRKCGFVANSAPQIGPIGLAALKNLREEGFEATIFEKASTIGGVWKFNPDHTVTSVLESELGSRQIKILHTAY